MADGVDSGDLVLMATVGRGIGADERGGAAFVASGAGGAAGKSGP